MIPDKEYPIKNLHYRQNTVHERHEKNNRKNCVAAFFVLFVSFVDDFLVDCS